MTSPPHRVGNTVSAQRPRISRGGLMPRMMPQRTTAVGCMRWLDRSFRNANCLKAERAQPCLAFEPRPQPVTPQKRHDRRGSG